MDEEKMEKNWGEGREEKETGCAQGSRVTNEQRV